MNRRWFVKFLVAVIVLSMIIPLIGYFAFG
jgi:hypothetical protein